MQFPRLKIKIVCSTSSINLPSKRCDFDGRWFRSCARRPSDWSLRFTSTLHSSPRTRIWLQHCFSVISNYPWSQMTTWWFGGVFGKQLDCNMQCEIAFRRSIFILISRRKGEQWTRYEYGRENEWQQRLHRLRKTHICLVIHFALIIGAFNVRWKCQFGDWFEGRIKLFNSLSSKSSATWISVSLSWFFVDTSLIIEFL